MYKVDFTCNRCLNTTYAIRAEKDECILVECLACEEVEYLPFTNVNTEGEDDALNRVQRST